MAGDRLLNEWVAQQLPYNTNCPQKKAKIDWQRERLITKIKQLIHENPFQDNEPGEATEVSGNPEIPR